jgi:hypothetical protein
MTANAGYHAYATGDVLTAAQVQYNLQNQTVMYFATTTARDASLTGSILVDGMVAYTPATGVMVYNGSAWVGIGASSIPTSYGFTAGKNAIINGAFNVWQRGTTFNLTGTDAYTTDRFLASADSATGTPTLTQQTFTPGTAPVSGYEGTYFPRITLSSSNTAWNFSQRIEDVRVFAGQTVTLSFWAKSSSSQAVQYYLRQNFGSGGSANVNLTGSIGTITTSWQRFTQTITLGSVAGKTIGTNSYLLAQIFNSSGVVASSTIDIWGVQLESGSSATSFQTATGTVQGELAACTYYCRKFATSPASGNNSPFTTAAAESTTVASSVLQFSPMRTNPSVTFGTAASDFAVYVLAALKPATAIALDQANKNAIAINTTHAAASFVAGNSGTLMANGNQTANILLEAEL